MNLVMQLCDDETEEQPISGFALGYLGVTGPNGEGFSWELPRGKEMMLFGTLIDLLGTLHYRLPLALGQRHNTISMGSSFAITFEGRPCDRTGVFVRDVPIGEADTAALREAFTRQIRSLFTQYKEKLSGSDGIRDELERVLRECEG